MGGCAAIMYEFLMGKAIAARRSLGAFKKMFGAPGSPMAPLRPRSAKGSPRWTIRAASFTGGGSGLKQPFISPSTSPTGTPRGTPSRGGSLSRLASDALAQATEQVQCRA